METANGPKKFLTVGETQAVLGSSRTFIYDLVSKKKLEIKKVGRRSYFAAAQVEGLFETKTT